MCRQDVWSMGDKDASQMLCEHASVALYQKQLGYLGLWIPRMVALWLHPLASFTNVCFLFACFQNWGRSIFPLMLPGEIIMSSLLVGVLPCEFLWFVLICALSFVTMQRLQLAPVQTFVFRNVPVTVWGALNSLLKSGACWCCRACCVDIWQKLFTGQILSGTCEL